VHLGLRVDCLVVDSFTTPKRSKLVDSIKVTSLLVFRMVRVIILSSLAIECFHLKWFACCFHYPGFEFIFKVKYLI